MPTAITEAEALALVADRELFPLEPYPGSAGQEWRVRCATCQRVSTITIKKLKTGVRGCRPCAIAERGAQRATTEDVAQELARLADLTPLEPYPRNTRTPWRCRCDRCGRDVTPKLNALQQGRGGCWDCGVRRRAASRRIADEQAMKTMMDRGLEPLTAYPGADTPWACRCAVCHHMVTPTLRNATKAKTSCAYCAGQRVDPSVAEAVMRAAGATPLTPYPGNDEPWSCRCQSCGKDIAPRHASIRQGQGPCLHCAGQIVDMDSAIKVMKAAGLDPNGPWPGSAKPWACVCRTCHRTVSPSYHNVRRGLARCSYCAQNRVDPAAAVELMRAAGLEPLEPYGGSKIPWRCRCVSCGNEVQPRYASIRSGQGGCATCAISGFDRAGPAIVYLTVSEAHRAVKVGVAGAESTRLSDHARQGWLTHVGPEEHVCIWPTETGAVALQVEAHVLEWWRLELGAPPALLHEQMPQRGASETASLDLVDLDATAERISAWLA
jgi:hypothetical protein